MGSSGVNWPLVLAHVSVKDYGAKGDGVTDDTAAIQAAINDSAVGASVFFPAGTYLVTAPVKLKPNRRYVGDGYGLAGTSTIKLKSGTNLTNAASLTGLLVAEGWSTNAASCDSPITVENLCVDGNKANNATSTACGIVVVNYQSTVRGCWVKNAPKHGILLTDTTANGSNTVNNSCSENTVADNRIEVTGGDGVKQICATGAANLDGRLSGNTVTGTTGSGIDFAKAAGWRICDNILYTVAQHGIYLTGCYGTLVKDNRLDDFGNENTASTYYEGIYVRQLNNNGTIVANNYVGCLEPAGTAHFEYISMQSSATQDKAQIICVGNMMQGPPGGATSAGLGLVATNGSGGAVLTLVCNSNRVNGINTSYIDPGVTVLLVTTDYNA